jgi:thymidylate synthase
MTHLFQESSADDLMKTAIATTLAEGELIVPTKGAARDLTAVVLELTNPLARLSRSASRGRLFSALGELVWYLAGSNDVDFIEYYISYYRMKGEQGVLWGGYGPRLFAFDDFDQIQYVISKLATNRSSRQAVVQLFDHQDVASMHEDVPCTCVLQFLVRRDALNAITYMRSNDAHFGLPHDIFAFTFIQELVARSLGLPIGRYVHMVGSFHIYEEQVPAAEAFLREGWQSNKAMPEMPSADPWPSVRWLLDVERALRTRQIDPTAVDLGAEPYWADLACLLTIFALLKANRLSEVEGQRQRLISRMYDVYIADRLA